MPKLAVEDKLEIMEMVSNVLGEAVKTPEVAKDVELQTSLIEELFQTMVALIEEDEEDFDDEEVD